jgi:TatD DNase family protein
LRLYDAHNHLQDARFASTIEALMSTARQEGVVRMVVNGSREEDWPGVLELARRYPEVLPSFGYHPWFVPKRTANWQPALVRYVEQVHSGVGEIGLDHWIKEVDLEQQEEVFIWQLRLAAERNLPVSIHCLKAWGRLLEILKAERRPRCGFVLHSFGGSKELIGPLAELGGYFSLPGYFAHERKARQRETFKHVPADRLLIETDAPEQLLPDALARYRLLDSGTGEALNHPANLAAVYQFAAELLRLPLEQLAERVEQNFCRLFRPA